jgi:acyl carrier protein
LSHLDESVRGKEGSSLSRQLLGANGSIQTKQPLAWRRGAWSRICPDAAAIAWQVAPTFRKGQPMTEHEQIFERIAEQIEPFNKKGVALTDATTFAGDLEWDSLTVMDFVAAIEDEFDILITMNMQAEIETVGQLVDQVIALRKD